MSAPDTSRSSAITDHPFEPATLQAFATYTFQPSDYLCRICRLAEAAHTETTVSRDAKEAS